jgi:hypothetical protein
MSTQKNEVYTKLAIDNCPIIYMHSKEKYFPSTVEDTLKLASYTNSVGNTVFTSADSTCLDTKIALMTDTCHKLTLNNEDYHLSIDTCAWTGFTPNDTNIFKKHLHDAPIYVHIRINDMYVEIVYNQYCPYNGCEVKLECIHEGAHESDWEHIRLRFTRFHEDEGIFRLHDAYFGAHGGLDGQWKKANQLEYHDGRVVAYSAKYSHAMYPNVGTYPMGLGTCIDTCDKGCKWDPKHNVIIITDIFPAWMKYTGNWGSTGVISLVKKGYWHDANVPNSDMYYSNTWYRRFFKLWGDCFCCLRRYKT